MRLSSRGVTSQPAQAKVSVSTCFLPYCCATERNLARRSLGGDVAAQPVHAGLVLVLVERHDARAAHHLAEQAALLDGVTRQLAVVLGAPVVNLLCKILGVEEIHHRPVAEAQTVGLLAVHEQRAQLVQQILAVAPAIFLQHHRRIGGVPAEELGLVGEEAHHGIASPCRSGRSTSHESFMNLRTISGFRMSTTEEFFLS